MDNGTLVNPASAGSGLTVGDFLDVLKQNGHTPFVSERVPSDTAFRDTQATTILGFKYADGVLIAGDRRATSGNAIVYDRADKVLDIDSHSVMAIAGSPGTAWEMARVLEHSFQYFRRTQLQEMSQDAKVRSLAKLIRENFGMALQGIGIVVPLFATCKPGSTAEGGARLYFYDAMGAQFEAAGFAASGSGSIVVRGVLYHQDRWGPKLKHLPRHEALVTALRALEASAEADSATGGVDRRTGMFPIMKLVGPNGIETIDSAEIENIFREKVA
jgi:proteasome beta subunit